MPEEGFGELRVEGGEEHVDGKRRRCLIPLFPGGSSSRPGSVGAGRAL